MRETIRKVLQGLNKEFAGESVSIFKNPRRFKSALDDVRMDEDGKRIRHVLNVAIRDVQVYARLEAETAEDGFIIDNLAAQMSGDYMIERDIARMVIECIAELLGYGPYEDCLGEGENPAEDADVRNRTVPDDGQADLDAGISHYRRLDFYKAQYHLLKAANAEHAEAQCALGDIFADERNPNHDVGYAMEWYGKAAMNGHARAQWLAGAGHLEGVGVAKDMDKARYWFQKSADQGDVDGQFGLAGYYMAVQDFGNMLVWLRKAAAQGHDEARGMLGVME